MCGKQKKSLPEIALWLIGCNLSVMRGVMALPSLGENDRPDQNS
ncbi:hypothetical protein PC1_1318 [Pectobacterium carotovorum subsp. carotovorum PC1]|uniref:Uncharacterized protein n=1 Tax=Pectobacterium carotovorum subsp. carotovorum (strain PC1) TaxID=561230 RepID=C6DCL5_PECCP|nr:hypothetical protein PC1_1318 [Pectobacterium carotovorum subsp. carotovorum PC1]